MISCPIWPNNKSRIYYNIIRLTNIVNKNPIIYNKLKRDMKILYVKIEIIELIKNFSCLIIYDIYDYINLYKNIW